MRISLNSKEILNKSLKNSFSIKKGKYNVNYYNSTTGGKLIWTLRKPINLKINSKTLVTNYKSN